MKDFWRGLSGKARVGLVAGAALVVVATGAGGWWLLRADYDVLFAELTPQDTAAMTGELDRLKVPYEVSEGAAGSGTTILVDKAEVYRTRIKLMGKDLPLHGAVGFELFNNSDFGMTEFAQKINYQRALQGELTRTILSLSEIRDARVLLALPEQGLFRQATSRPRASVTLALKPGRALRPDQVNGIQRLVAAAVPGIATQDVTLVDQSGVALTRASGDSESADAASGRLDLKKDTENYLSRKATQVLEHALGPGQALASVDVELDMDRVQTTTEDVVSAPGRPGHAQTGVVVREREALREVGAPLDARAKADASAEARSGTSQREVEYAVGKRVEQVMRQPGTIRRVQVVAVVRQALEPAEEARIVKLVAASVGASLERGDTVVVQTMKAITAVPAPPDGKVAAAEPATAWQGRDAHAAGTVARASDGPGATARLAGAAAIALAAALWTARALRRRARGAPSTVPAARLTDEERQAALAQVQAWMSAGREPGRGLGGLS